MKKKPGQVLSFEDARRREDERAAAGALRGRKADKGVRWRVTLCHEGGEVVPNYPVVIKSVYEETRCAVYEGGSEGAAKRAFARAVDKSRDSVIVVGYTYFERVVVTAERMEPGATPVLVERYDPVAQASRYHDVVLLSLRESVTAMLDCESPNVRIGRR